jgi:hypothetical protein
MLTPLSVAAVAIGVNQTHYRCFVGASFGVNPDSSTQHYGLSVTLTKNSLALLWYGFLQHGAGLTLLWIGMCHLFDLSPHRGQGLT